MMHMHHDSLDGPCACAALRKAARAVSRVYDDALAHQGMTTTQFAILRHVARHGAIGLSQLAERLGMDRTTLYRGVAPLQAKGWIAVTPGRGKIRLASLTSAGVAMLQATEQDWRAVQERIVSALGEEQWKTLQSVLTSVTAIAQEAMH